LAILHLKAKTIPLDLPVAVLERLARRLPGYIRRLEGAMFRIAQPSGGKNVPPDIAVVDDLIVELLKAEQI
jgi:chromosomal replication initiation ATPase DnaA